MSKCSPRYLTDVEHTLVDIQIFGYPKGKLIWKKDEVCLIKSLMIFNNVSILSNRIYCKEKNSYKFDEVQIQKINSLEEKVPPKGELGKKVINNVSMTLEQRYRYVSKGGPGGHLFWGRDEGGRPKRAARPTQEDNFKSNRNNYTKGDLVLFGSAERISDADVIFSSAAASHLETVN